MTDDDRDGSRAAAPRLALTVAAALAVAAVIAIAVWLALPIRDQASAEGDGETDAPAEAAQAGDEAPSFPDRYDHFGIAIGPEDAPVTVREFGDYQCPACGRFASVAERLREEYVADGRVRFIFFDFPIVSMHDNALPAAQAARCAGRQGDYWAMHDSLFAEQGAWSDAEDPVTAFRDYAEENGLDGDELADCVQQSRTREAVMQSLSFGQNIGVSSTPTVVVNSTLMPGVPSYQQLEQVIREELDSAGR